ncbi:MAG: 5'-3' exonuclease H3TH domain-containing protein, partial [Pseudomonadota bacterium]
MAQEQNNSFVLIDGSSYLFRAYHALPPLTSKQGEPTGAILGVMNMLKKLNQEHDTKNVAVVFDTKGKNFRHALFPDYKANRTVMPDDLAVQIQPLQDMIRAMGFPVLAFEGLEADDVIATLAKQAIAQGRHVIISTGDKDFAQLVDGHLTLVNTMTDTILDREGVLEKFGVYPERIIDYLTLVGDTVDNIPGVPKVGPKTAVKWLQTYGTLDNLIAHADEITGKVGEYLRETLPKLPCYKQLVTIKDDLQLPIEYVSLVHRTPNIAELQAFCQRFDFRSWITELSIPQEKVHYET